MENRSIDELKAGFDNFWMQKLLPYQQELEKTRKKYLRIFLLHFCLVTLVAIAISPWAFEGGFWHENMTEEQTCKQFATIVLILIAFDATKWARNKFRKESKNRVMPQLIKYFDVFSYQFGGGIGADTISKSKLLPRYHMRISDDCFSGTYKKVDIKVSEEHLKRIESSDKSSSEITIFKGVIVVLTVNKKFDGQTMVVSDKGIFNKLDALSIALQGRENIRLEDSVFEKEFEIYGTNQIEARYLLTPAFMERILKLRQAYKSKRIEFSFFNNKLFIAISLKKDMFESASLFHSCLDRKPIDETFNQILSIIEIVDILKLDTLKISN